MREFTENELQILALIAQFGSIDGEHHKMWVIDQIARIINKEDYSTFVAAIKMGEDGPETYKWDTGIAP